MAENAKEKDVGQVTLKNVLCSFPNVFEVQKPFIDPKTGEQGKLKYKSNFLFDHDDEANLNACKKAAERVKLKKYGSKDKFPKFKPEKIALRDGDQEDWEGYAGRYYVSCNNERQPKVVDRDKRPLEDKDGKIYGGAIVNAVIRFWVQDNEYGRRINCSIEAIQFVKHGEPFGAAAVDTDEEFETLEDDDDMESIGDSGADGSGDDDDDLL